MIGAKLTNLFLWMLIVLVGAGFFVIQVWKQNEYVALVKNNRELVRQVERLKSDIAAIELDRKDLKSFSRLEKLGRDKFGFVYPSVPEFVYPDKTHEIKTASQPWDDVVSWFQREKREK